MSIDKSVVGNATRVKRIPPRPSADQWPRLGPDLLRVLADLEGLRVGVRVLVDRRCELAAFAILVAGDRPADAVELGGEHRVPQRLATDIGDTGAVGLRDLLERL